MFNPTPTQIEVLEIVRDQQEVGIPVGISDVAKVRACSYSTARSHVLDLLDEAALSNTPGKHRSLKITAKGRRAIERGTR